MCKECDILTYDEVLKLIEEITAREPLRVEPRQLELPIKAYPQSIAPLIVANFDTALGSRSVPNSALLARELSWGFDQSWKPGVIFNTRVESATKPLWHDSITHRRCILPVRSFFETHESETVSSPKTGRPIKRPYEFVSSASDVMLIGCIWKDDCFSMMTTQANASMMAVHHRMPLIVRQEELPIWFSGDYASLANRDAITLECAPAI